MTNHEFIHRRMTGDYDGKQRQHSHLLWDGAVLYSYGHHYPLAIKIDGQWIVNNAPVSHTTTKHSRLAGQYAYLSVPFKDGGPYSGYQAPLNHVDVYGLIETQANDAKNELDAKSANKHTHPHTIKILTERAELWAHRLRNYEIAR